MPANLTLLPRSSSKHLVRVGRKVWKDFEGSRSSYGHCPQMFPGGPSLLASHINAARRYSWTSCRSYISPARAHLTGPPTNEQGHDDGQFHRTGHGWQSQQGSHRWTKDVRCSQRFRSRDEHAWCKKTHPSALRTKLTSICRASPQESPVRQSIQAPWYDPPLMPSSILLRACR